ncbi:hypothetical protein [Nocardia testacea]|uniref:hypothetical protein n=1 Tax=Nocardia testacea TaxID=248551 RepID=UPI0033CAE9F4
MFALLLEDIDLDASDPYLDITGTLVETKGAGAGGLDAQTAPEVGQRLAPHLLPEHTVEAIREA